MEEGNSPLEGCSGDWILVEAEEEGGACGGDAETDSDDGYDMVDFIDDTEVPQGNSAALYHAQTLYDTAVLPQCKRKHVNSPKVKPVCDLSPRLAAINIGTESQQTAKRRLFVAPPDSGYGNTLEEANTQEMGETEVPGGNGGEGEHMVAEAFGQERRRAAMLGQFKERFGISFCDLTRPFKSNKTTCGDWVVYACGMSDALADATSDLLSPHCIYGNITKEHSALGNSLLMLLRFTHAKNRDTLTKLLGSHMTIPAYNIVAEPPKIRCPAAAIFWYRRSTTQGVTVFGDVCEWITKQVTVGGGECAFELSTMIQWAYDSDLTDEAQVAYEYAKLADSDRNAEAFLKSNCQAKYVKDCCTMVRLYKKAEMHNMTMGQWVRKQADRYEGEGNYRPIVQFLKFQGIEFIPFMHTLAQFLKGIPKRNCLVIHGPPNTGKSLFTMSLCSFLGGKVISFVNSKSHFWLQPLGECKVALLDDATRPCWDYFDLYLRNLLDGNPVSLDAKHRAPIQIKGPPLLITSNVDISTEDRWKYLHSRVRCFSFPNTLPLDSKGDPVYELTALNWKSFFTRLWSRLDLKEGSHGEAFTALRCTTGPAAGPD